MKHISERVLVVDDTPMNIDLLEGILTPVGYTVDSAESGEEALDKVSDDTPDLILLDAMMPKMNGYAGNGGRNQMIPGGGRGGIYIINPLSFFRFI